MSNGHVSLELTPRDDADIADEEIVISSADVHVDTEELTAEKAAEKMIERRIQVRDCRLTLMRMLKSRESILVLIPGAKTVCVPVCDAQLLSAMQIVPTH